METNVSLFLYTAEAEVKFVSASERASRRNPFMLFFIFFIMFVVYDSACLDPVPFFFFILFPVRRVRGS